jgi:hypothetical protein
MDLDLVGQQSRALVAFVLPVSIENRLLLWTLVRSQTYYLEHILAYKDTHLIMLPAAAINPQAR